jgi:hypothetical protein
VSSFDNILLRDDVSDTARRIVADLLAKQKAESRPALSRKDAGALLGVGVTKLLQLEAAGKLDGFLDGASRRITTASLYRYLIGQVIKSHPVDGPAVKVRQPPKQFRRAKAPRPRTEAELDGLRRGNERRRLEAQARRSGASSSAEAENTA